MDRPIIAPTQMQIYLRKKKRRGLTIQKNYSLGCIILFSIQGEYLSLLPPLEQNLHIKKNMSHKTKDFFIQTRKTHRLMGDKQIAGAKGVWLDKINVYRLIC